MEASESESPTARAGKTPFEIRMYGERGCCCIVHDRLNDPSLQSRIITWILLQCYYLNEFGLKSQLNLFNCVDA